jgi:methyltransferase (TIGR00027 family)
MTLDPVAQTSRLTAALRARESARPEPLFTDPYAARLAGETGEALLRDFGDNATIAVRTHFFDARVTASPLPQLVILAAGMDSRAYRLDFPPDVTVYELDRPEVLELKGSLLADATPCHRVPVGVDLATDWRPALHAAGFRPDVPTRWLVEGLTQYLPAVDTLLDHVTAVSAPSSELLIDFVGQSLLDSPAMRPMLDQFAAMDMTWRFGTDQPEDLLEPRGWRADVTPIGDVGTALGRWPYPSVPRGTPGVGQGYLVHARR